MANKHKGEFSFRAGEDTYTLVMDMDAMEACESHFSTPDHDVFFPEVMEKVQRGSVKHTKVFFWAAMQRHHPETTLAQTNDIVQLAGGYYGVGAQIANGLAAFVVPDEEDVKTLGLDQNPLQAQGDQEKTRRRRRGTGTDSTATLDASV